MLGAGNRGKRESGLLCFLARQITAVRNYGGESAAKILHVARASLLVRMLLWLQAPVRSRSHTLFVEILCMPTKLLAKPRESQCLGRVPKRGALLRLVRRREAVRPGSNGSGSSARL